MEPLRFVIEIWGECSIALFECLLMPIAIIVLGKQAEYVCMDSIRNLLIIGTVAMYFLYWMYFLVRWSKSRGGLVLSWRKLSCLVTRNRLRLLPALFRNIHAPMAAGKLRALGKHSQCGRPERHISCIQNSPHFAAPMLKPSMLPIVQLKFEGT